MEGTEEDLDTTIRDTSDEPLAATNLNKILIIVVLVLAAVVLVQLYQMRNIEQEQTDGIEELPREPAEDQSED